VYFDGALRDVPIFDRANLGPGMTVSGPAVIEEYGSTTVIQPGQVALPDRSGNLLLRGSDTVNT
jgi:N-methylhydantoinase A